MKIIMKLDNILESNTLVKVVMTIGMHGLFKCFCNVVTDNFPICTNTQNE